MSFSSMLLNKRNFVPVPWRLYVSFLAISGLTGCLAGPTSSLVWRPASGEVSQLQFDTDVMECKILAWQVVPATPPPVLPEEPGFARGYAEGRYYRQIREEREEKNNVRNLCMRQRGYELVDAKK